MNLTTRIVASLTLLCTSLIQAEFEAEVDGVVPGKWTMDLAAATALATEKKQPLLLNFTGSDWCGWCIQMEKSVFSKEAWRDYAKDHIVMVMLDYPRDKSRVPEKYEKRNQALKDTYDISSFPTFVIVSSDGQHELGRLTAGPQKTPASFQAELEDLLRYSELGVKSYCADLEEEKSQEYQKLYQELKRREAESEQLVSEIEKAKQKSNTLLGGIVNHKKKMAAFRISQMSEEKQAEYEAFNRQLTDTRAELLAWKETKPVKSEENTKKQEAYRNKIRALLKKIDSY